MGIRDFWWRVRYAALSHMGLPFKVYIRYSPYLCALRKMIRESERKRISWASCRWCDAPRSVNPEKESDGMCETCWYDWKEAHRDTAERKRRATELGRLAPPFLGL